jgi:hypothetical protein
MKALTNYQWELWYKWLTIYTDDGDEAGFLRTIIRTLFSGDCHCYIGSQGLQLCNNHAKELLPLLDPKLRVLES